MDNFAYATGDRTSDLPTRRCSPDWDGSADQCLPAGAPDEQFKQMWARYAPASDDPRSTVSGDLPAEDQHAAASASFDLAVATVVADTKSEQPATPPNN